MLGAWDVRQLLDRKYAIMERENAIKQQDTTSAGLLRGAQARGMDVNTGLAPGLAKSEMGERDARALGLRTEAGLAPGLAASTISRNASANLVDRAQVGQINATTGLTKAQTTGVTDMSTYNRDLFKKTAPTAPYAASMGMPAIDSLDASAPRSRSPLLNSTMRGSFGMTQF